MSIMDGLFIQIREKAHEWWKKIGCLRFAAGLVHTSWTQARQLADFVVNPWMALVRMRNVVHQLKVREATMLWFHP